MCASPSIFTIAPCAPEGSRSSPLSSSSPPAKAPIVSTASFTIIPRSRTASSSESTYGSQITSRQSRETVASIDAITDSPDSASTITPGVAPVKKQLRREAGGIAGSFGGDPDVQKFVDGLDKWTGLMKKAIIADFVEAKSDSNDRIVVKNLRDLQSLQDRLSVSEKQAMDFQKKLQTSEKIGTARLNLVDCAATCLINKRSKAVAFLAFARWRLRFAEAQKDIMYSQVAIRHCRRALQRRVFEAWQHDVGSSWRKRQVKKLKADMDKTTEALSAGYEKRISELTVQLNDTILALKESESKRTNAQSEMKQAFMRGVCALNMEAMTVFRDGPVCDSDDQAKCNNDKPSLSDNTSTGTKSERGTPPTNPSNNILQPIRHSSTTASNRSNIGPSYASAATTGTPPMFSPTSSGAAPVSQSSLSAFAHQAVQQQPIRGVYVTRHVSSPGMEIPRKNVLPMPSRYPSRG
ncbi:hypothetical protein SeLEV6574_g00121 [Synchytrium endobioticum]|uniref:Centrosomal protein POC5 n=1 Tax=Synchytrium endobioticum TaxID=286115 RepID=A0A507DJZ4_9FUNG|nr:hypothetical protein SeLEV6574_g00121 [Synchytrium endobioticum]